MTRPVGRAALEIIGDASKLAASIERELNRVLRSLKLDVQPAADRIARELSRGVEAVQPALFDLEDKAASTFRDIADHADRAFDGVGRSADGVSERVGREFRSAADAADRAFSSIGADAGGSADRVGREFQQGGERAEAAFRELGRVAGREFAQIAAQARASAAATGAATSGGLLGAAGGLKAGLATAAAAIGTGLAAITVFGLKSAASMEQTQIAFNSLLGSVEKGQAAFNELQQFAAKTPFEFPDVAHAASRFFAFSGQVGLAKDQVTQFLTTIGNVASVTGGGAQALDSVTLAMGQIASSGKLTLENLNQISEAMPGFSAVAAIAAATGKPTAQVMEEISAGSINAAVGIKALLAGMATFPGAAGAMEAQSQTLLGVFSTFKDTLTQALVGGFAPVIPAIKDAITAGTPELQEAIGQLAPALGSAFSALIPLVTELIQIAGPALKPLIDGVGVFLRQAGETGGLVELGKALGDVAAALFPLFGLLGDATAALASGLTPIVAALAPVIVGVSRLIDQALTPLLPVVVQIGQTLGAVLLPVAQLLGDLFAQLGPVVAELAAALTAALLPIFQALGPAIAPIVEALVPMIPAVVSLIPPITQIVIALIPLVQLLASLLGVVAPLIVPVVQLAAVLIQFLASAAVVPLIQLLAEALTAVLSPVTALVGPLTSLGNILSGIDWGNVAKSIGGGLATAAKAVGGFFADLGGVIGEFFVKLPGRIGDALAALPGLLLAAMVFGFESVLRGIGIVIGLILAAIIGVVKLIIFEWTKLPGIVGDFVHDMFFKALDIITTQGPKLLDFFASLPGKIGSALAALGSAIGQAFVSAFKAAKDLVVQRGEEILHFFAELPGRIRAFAGKMLDAGISFIKNFFTGLARAPEFVGDLIGAIVRGLKSGLNFVIDRINEGIDFVGRVLPFDLPHIPRLARGGLTTNEGMAILHPQEAILPLEDRRTTDLLSRALAEAQNNLRTLGVPTTQARSGGTPIVKVFIGDQELKTMIRVEIDESDRELDHQLAAGPRG